MDGKSHNLVDLVPNDHVSAITILTRGNGPEGEREREGMHLGVALITTLEITLYFVVDPQELLILHN